MSEYDDSKPYMTQDFHVHITVRGPDSDVVPPGPMEVEAAVSDGPEIIRPFHASSLRYLVAEDDHNEGTLAKAVSEIVNGMIECALECEADHWTRNHEEVYLVSGVTAGPTAPQSWPVKAFLNHDLAIGLAAHLNEWCVQRRVHADIPGDQRAEVIDPNGELVSCPEDPQFRVDRDGVAYRVTAVPVDMTNAWR